MAGSVSLRVANSRLKARGPGRVELSERQEKEIQREEIITDEFVILITNFRSIASPPLCRLFALSQRAPNAAMAQRGGAAAYDPTHPSDPGLIAPSSGHSPFARLPLPASFTASAFPSTSNTSSPYVTDQPRSALNRTFGGGDYVPPNGNGKGKEVVNPSTTTTTAAAGSKAPEPGAAEPRGQTLEEMYSAPENTLEIEVRDPQTRGESRSRQISLDSFFLRWRIALG